MSITVFLALCILGCDFLLYVLYQFTYGEKRRGLSRRSAAPKSAVNQPDARPFLVAYERGTSGSKHRFPSERQRAFRGEAAGLGLYGEARAYRRIAQAFAEVKR